MAYTYPISINGTREKKVELIEDIFGYLRQSQTLNDEPKTFDDLYDKSVSELMDIRFKLRRNSPYFTKER